jgi:hypothetical protein
LPDDETVMDCVVSPVDQRYDAPALEVNVTLPPSQKFVAPDVAIVGVAGAGLTTTFVAALVPEQPPPVIVTVKLPLVVTTIDWVVAPLDHRYEDADVAVSVTLLPSQNVVGPEALMVGVAAALTLTDTGALAAEQPFASVTVTL